MNDAFEQPQHRLTADTQKPATPLTLGIVFYNQAQFAEDAVRGALAQDYSPLEIVLSDDASTDGTFEVLQRSIAGYGGLHTIVLNRNERNLGLADNVNRVMELATGEILLLGGGDDIPMPQLAARSASILQGEPDCMAVSFGTVRFQDKVSANIELQPKAEYKRYTRTDYLDKPFFHLGGASRAFRRRAFDLFGPISPDCPTEDSVMLLRCFLLGDVLGTPEQQVYYRVHEGNLSMSTNQYLIDPAAIHEQYLRDLEVAREKGLLSAEELVRFVSMLSARLERRMLERDAHLESNPLGYLLGSIIRSTSLSSREKLRMSAGALARRLRR